MFLVLTLWQAADARRVRASEGGVALRTNSRTQRAAANAAAGTCKVGAGPASRSNQDRTKLDSG